MAPLILLLATICSIAQGQSVFNFNNEICCNGTVHKKPLLQDYNYECCGNELLFQSNKYKVDEFCCGSTILSKEDGLDCCGGSPYDRKLSDCYNKTTVADIPEAEIKAGNTHACGVSFDDIKFYNATTHLCCKGHIRKKESRSHLCCGEEVHDSSTTACCDGVATPQQPGSIMVCCAQNLYNPNTQICCQHNVFDNPEEPLDTDVNKGHTLQQRSFPAPKRRQYTANDCCGAELYNRTSQMCCRNITIHADGVHEEQIVLHTLAGGENLHFWQCCGTDLYDANILMCSDDKLYQKNATITRHCCKSTYQYEVYNWQWLKMEDQNDVEDEDWCFIKGSSITVYNGRMVETCYENMWSKFNSSLPTCNINGQIENYDPSRQVCSLKGVVDVPKKDGIEQDPNPQWLSCDVQ